MDRNRTLESLESRVLLFAGAGLQADYFSDTNLSVPAFSRTDGQIDFNRATPAPGAPLPDGRFSARWSGQVQPKHTELYRFSLRGDGGLRLWVNGQKLIDEWHDRGVAIERSAPITLVGGRKYDIVVEYTDRAGSASLTLQWTSSNQRREVVPTAQLFPSERGSILRELWSGVTGSSVLDLTNRAAYPNSPSGVAPLASFEAPTGSGDNYGQRLRGFIHPPQSGYYTFHISGDNTAELHLSTGTDPGRKRLIASVPAFTGSRQWDKYPAQKSAEVYLLAGQSYYIETLHKEATGSDHLAVGWTLPDGTFDGAPIAGRFLSPPLAEVRISADSHAVVENGVETAVMTLTRTGGVISQPLTVNYTTTGTATNGADYEQLPGTVTFAPGATTAQLTLRPVNDLLPEARKEQAVITIADGAGYSVPPESSGSVSATIHDEDGLPQAGVPVTLPDYIGHFNLSGVPTYASRQNVPVTGMPFAQAIQATVSTQPGSPVSVQLVGKNTTLVSEGDVMLATFYARAASGPGKFALVFERSVSPWDKSVTQNFTVGGQWQRFDVPFVAHANFHPTQANFSFQLGQAVQTLQFGGISLTNYGPGITVDDLPTTVFNYDGRSGTGAWRGAADQRVEENRKGDLNVVVRDLAGNVVEGALVAARMKAHEFGFGTAVQAAGIDDTSANGAKYRLLIKELFNKAVLENDLKWPEWQKDRQNAIDAVNWLVASGITDVRGHTLVWPGWRWIPSSTGTSSGVYKTVAWSASSTRPASQAEYEAHVTADGSTTAKAWLRSRINAHIAEEAGHASLKGKVTEWDVLNEPYGNHHIQDILGNAEMVEWFKLAKAADPSAKLFLNDYPSLGGGEHLDWYHQTIQWLLANGAPLEGIGFQSHFVEAGTSINAVLANLDRFGAFGKPIEMTEFDMTTRDEQYQADFVRDYLTASFSHPAVSAFLVWGFWESRHWRPDAAMYRADFSIKPAGQQFKDLVFGDWWTDARGTTDRDGRYATRGFAGDYELGVSVGDYQQAPLNVDVPADGSRDVTVTLNALVLSGTAGNDNVRVRRDASGEYRVWVNAPASGAPTHVVPASASIIVRGRGGDDVLTFDLAGGGTIPAGGFHFDGGAGNDRIRTVGSDAKEDIVIEGSRTHFGSGNIMHPGVEGVEVDATNTSLLNAAAAVDTLTVAGTANVSLTAAQDLASLSIGGAALVKGPATGLFRTAGLTITDSAQLDLGENELIVTGGNEATVNALVASARNGGADGEWTGRGITSAAARANPLTTLGVGTSGADVVVKLTYNGDADLSGGVDLDDYFAVDANFLTPPATTVFATGDFNYDGEINLDDYFLIDSAFLGQGSPMVTSGTASPSSATAAVAGTNVMDTTNSDAERSQTKRRKRVRGAARASAPLLGR